ncbi:hypothetical protein CDL12_02838 [Handroanthus impetiginosus]|uniref:AT3G52170-like helix-turn-helix domain-containing protein n=1 Tax=Handroanthus impetiginosus TaxID=429701 RepID=A0A2G9I3V9_9LAMI|nr:hypothetical protein CDL12_02838 [Handroanthus impetiginosus]
MHAVKGGWAGRAFAIAASNDSGGRKSRIRRSKEERKSMVESFIKKYQKLNDGNFPSITLTHKEVGGSFYTVREIVREIIQENRVLASPKVSSEEHNHSTFLEQHPLGSISVEPQIDLSVSDGTNMATDVMPNEYQITSEEMFSSSNMQFNGSYPLELENEEIANGVSKVADGDDVSDKTNKSYHSTNLYEGTHMEEGSNYTEQLPQPKGQEFGNEKIVTDVEVLEENANSDRPLVVNVDHKDDNNSAIESKQNLKGPASQRLINEQYLNKNDHMVDKTKEFGERVSVDPAVMEILDKEKHEAQDAGASQAVKPYMNFDVVVETFPLRPVPQSIHDVGGESGKLPEAAGTLEDKAIQPDQRTFTRSSPDLVNEQNKEKLSESAVGLNGRYRDQNMVLNPQSPSRASNSMELLTLKDSTAVGKKSSDEDDSTLPKGNNPEKINVETSGGASKNSIQPESNPILVLVKAFISSFVKFWTE